MRPRQDDHRDRIAEDPEETDQIDEYAIDNEVGQTVGIDLLSTFKRFVVAAVIGIAEILYESTNIVITGSDRCRGCHRAYFHRSTIFYRAPIFYSLLIQSPYVTILASSLFFLLILFFGLSLILIES